jgi:hypothetical protein
MLKSEWSCVEYPIQKIWNIPFKEGIGFPKLGQGEVPLFYKMIIESNLNSILIPKLFDNGRIGKYIVVSILQFLIILSLYIVFFYERSIFK